jgi:hypothetical protein
MSTCAEWLIGITARYFSATLEYTTLITKYYIFISPLKQWHYYALSLNYQQSKSASATTRLFRKLKALAANA